MRLDLLQLRNVRSYREAEVRLAPGLTALVGRNGQGKTNVLEAIAYLATFRSFRAATSDVMVRDGEAAAHIRAQGKRADGRDVLIEVEINRSGRNRLQLNRQRLNRPRDAVGVLRVTLFSPDDLAIVKEGPQLRRDLLDDLTVDLDRRADVERSTFERVLRQRNALLRQCGGRLDSGASLTLDVWDAKLAPVGEAIVARRAAVLEALAPEAAAAYGALAGTGHAVSLALRPSAPPGGLAAALAAGRAEDVRRGVTMVGPHRDEVELMLRGAPVRTHGSQGEQRSFALALKLGGHHLVTRSVGEAPLLLLDDVFSELDPQRCDALVANLPPGQAVLTSADRLPGAAHADAVLRVVDGRIDA